ncbi:MAG: Holliday junction branch migration protein RuvA [Patescibacteria group bacterium]|nr:Holliday junction branch migration protein RuvA [Patescibacteria group bacterium]MDE1944086.1 Holliday junction branch migration protein RuvA [Patescibacteria group bacterium]MDE1944703.1 Holliday junction branch migration protein RuvA [Patescibacteria group bacterium]MDE2057594.1 Holliday junction branch migration protein RuvA [Patescibacteria group bacterium]
MIRSIRGPVISLSAAGAVIEVAGFGVEVHLADTAGLAEGREAALATHLAVKQDGMELYGFADAPDRDFFEKLLAVPGVGPKTALGVLRRAPRRAIATAIAARDLGYLTKVVGLGKKLAEKMLVELGEKIAPGEDAQGPDSEVFETLVALGYTEREARRAVQAIPQGIDGKDARLRAALSAK